MICKKRGRVKGNLFRLGPIILGLIILFPAQVFSLSGSQIMEKAFQANIIESFRAVIALNTQTGRGKNFNLKLTVLGKGDPRKDLSLLLIFREPPSSRGIKLLVLARKDTLTKVYVYMPAIGKYFHLVGEDRNMKLGDSEMTIYDLVAILPWEGKHKLIGEEKYNGSDCYLVESIFPGEKNKRITRIGKKTLLPLTTQKVDLRGNCLKTVEVLNFKKVISKYAITSLRVTNLQNYTTTTMKVLSSKWYINIPDEVFQPEKLGISLLELMEERIENEF